VHACAVHALKRDPIQGQPRQRSTTLLLLCVCVYVCVWPRTRCSLRERRRCVVVLLCGTSGSGKSTLASILVRWHTCV
jgi:pantothenate kinase-related protein Tda10